MRSILRSKYRLVILNDSTFSEKFSIRLSPQGLLIGFSAATILFILLVISTVAFTPLREYIPGYGNIAERKQILKLNLKADSLERTLESREVYLKNLLNVFNGNVEGKSPRPSLDTSGKYSLRSAKPSKTDIEFREAYEKESEKTIVSSMNPSFSGLGEFVFFTPAKGIITTSFNIPDQHYGVDIVTKPDETIKSTLDGTVIYASFSASDGNVLQIQHNNNLVSIYKHCSVFIKKTGDRVKSGEAIAVVGNTGEKSNGPHLHFELWFNGSPINPQEFVAF